MNMLLYFLKVKLFLIAIGLSLQNISPNITGNHSPPLQKEQYLWLQSRLGN